ncbi:MAG: NYN domain-containing protein [bacterium]
MSEEKYILIPRAIESGDEIIKKIFHQLCLLMSLKRKHPLIPEVSFHKMNTKSLNEYSLLPGNYSSEDLELLNLYFTDEIREIKDKRDINNSLLPFPVLKSTDFCFYQDIAADLHQSKSWILELIDFFAFLTKENFLISTSIIPEDFLYDQHLNIRYFINYDCISISGKSEEELIEENIYALANLLNRYYLQDTEIYQAKLYQKEWFKKLESNLIEPLLYQIYSGITYYSFADIKKDLLDKMSAAKKIDEKIFVFLDVANISTAMYSGFMKMEIDFDKLFLRLYGRSRVRNIYRRVAVMFLPVYDQGLTFKEDKYNLIFEIKSYLESYQFEIEMVENATAAAKMRVNGQEVDADDSKLINIMEENIDEIDGALLISGDAHFLDIARRFKKAGKEIKLLSVSEENTSKELRKEFDHQYIYQFYDCIK